METILVTGDIVLDGHLYGGVYAGVGTGGGSVGGPGASYAEHLGGAVLTHELLQAAAAAAGAKKQAAPAYEPHLDLDTQGLATTLPAHLRSYGAWVAQPARKGSRDVVWRWSVTSATARRTSAPVHLRAEPDAASQLADPDPHRRRRHPLP